MNRSIINIICMTAVIATQSTHITMASVLPHTSSESTSQLWGKISTAPRYIANHLQTALAGVSAITSASLAIYATHRTAQFNKKLKKLRSIPCHPKIIEKLEETKHLWRWWRNYAWIASVSMGILTGCGAGYHLTKDSRWATDIDDKRVRTRIGRFLLGLPQSRLRTYPRK
jgi:hypothetical protein